MELRNRAADIGDQKGLSALRKRQNAAVNGYDNASNGTGNRTCVKLNVRRVTVVERGASKRLNVTFASKDT